MSKKISICVGTRPEIIKMAPLIMELKRRPEFEVSVCATGQHGEMADQVFTAFGIVPDVQLYAMNATKTLTGNFATLTTELDAYFETNIPDIVLAQGDTYTVLAAAIAAYNRQIAFGHVEAGLRTGNLYAPWPEEGYRAMVSTIATYNFAPTEVSQKNLLAAGAAPETIHVVGNTVIDALLYMRNKLTTERPDLALPTTLLDDIDARFVLMTGHRRENFDGGLLAVFQALNRLARLYPDVQFVFPVHYNPVVREQVATALGDEKCTNIHLIDPVPYPEFVWLLERAHLIITDSGGIQEEAPSLGKPVLVTRSVTERPEAVTAGTVLLTGTDTDTIVTECTRLLDDADAYQRMSVVTNPYGDGTAAIKIANALT